MYLTSISCLRLSISFSLFPCFMMNFIATVWWENQDSNQISYRGTRLNQSILPVRYTFVFLCKLSRKSLRRWARSHDNPPHPYLSTRSDWRNEDLSEVRDGYRTAKIRWIEVDTSLRRVKWSRSVGYQIDSVIEETFEIQKEGKNNKVFF